MSETGSDGAKDVFFSLENIVRKKNPSHHSNPNFVNGIQNYTYVGNIIFLTVFLINSEKKYNIICDKHKPEHYCCKAALNPIKNIYRSS
jgi:hypothetical protein